jgi:hypothetical protein
MELEVPDKLQIGGFTYQVRCCPEEDANLDKINAWGRYNEGGLFISVHSKANPQQMAKTLIEEISHAIEVVYASKQLPHEDLKDMAQGWFQVMEQNGVRFVKTPKPLVSLEAHDAKCSTNYKR